MILLFNKKRKKKGWGWEGILYTSKFKGKKHTLVYNLFHNMWIPYKNLHSVRDVMHTMNAWNGYWLDVIALPISGLWGGLSKQEPTKSLNNLIDWPIIFNSLGSGMDETKQMWKSISKDIKAAQLLGLMLEEFWDWDATYAVARTSNP